MRHGSGVLARLLRACLWLSRWLLDTEKMQKSDPVAKGLVTKYKMPMPNPGLRQDEVRQS